jgi:hypothetical protein
VLKLQELVVKIEIHDQLILPLIEKERWNSKETVRKRKEGNKNTMNESEINVRYDFYQMMKLRNRKRERWRSATILSDTVERDMVSEKEKRGK